jgi:hypothetical protein
MSEVITHEALWDAVSEAIPCQNLPGWCEKLGDGTRGRAEWIVHYPKPAPPYLVCDRCFQRGVLYNGFVASGAWWERL